MSACPRWHPFALDKKGGSGSAGHLAQLLAVQGGPAKKTFTGFAEIRRKMPAVLLRGASLGDSSVNGFHSRADLPNAPATA